MYMKNAARTNREKQRVNGKMRTLKKPQDYEQIKNNSV